MITENAMLLNLRFCDSYSCRDNFSRILTHSSGIVQRQYGNFDSCCRVLSCRAVTLCLTGASPAGTAGEVSRSSSCYVLISICIFATLINLCNQIFWIPSPNNYLLRCNAIVMMDLNSSTDNTFHHFNFINF